LPQAVRRHWRRQNDAASLLRTRRCRIIVSERDDAVLFDKRNVI